MPWIKGIPKVHLGNGVAGGINCFTEFSASFDYWWLADNGITAYLLIQYIGISACTHIPIFTSLQKMGTDLWCSGYFLPEHLPLCFYKHQPKITPAQLWGALESELRKLKISVQLYPGPLALDKLCTHWDSVFFSVVINVIIPTDLSCHHRWVYIHKTPKRVSALRMRTLFLRALRLSPQF